MVYRECRNVETALTRKVLATRLDLRIRHSSHLWDVHYNMNVRKITRNWVIKNAGFSANCLLQAADRAHCDDPNEVICQDT